MLTETWAVNSFLIPALGKWSYFHSKKGPRRLGLLSHFPDGETEGLW